MTREKHITKVALKSVGEMDANGNIFSPKTLRQVAKDFKEGDCPIKTTPEGSKIVEMEYDNTTGTLFAYVEVDQPPEELEFTVSSKSEKINPKMAEKRAWEEFREAGMLWFVNRFLHLFGWAIAVEIDPKTKEVTEAYPVRCKFRGFSEASEEKGFEKVTDFLVKNIDELKGDLKL